jgi:hypothetical protein
MKTLASLATTLGLGLAGLSVVACAPVNKKPLSMQEMITADPLPLAKGASWTFDVRIRRFDADANKEVVKTIAWTTEVVDAREANGVTAYLVKGWPSDLAALESSDTATPTQTTVLRQGNNFMFGKTPDPSLDGAQGWFSWPMIDGQKFCPKAETVYCWQVAAIDTGYSLTFNTGPDEQSFDLEPNTGISRFHYAHHISTNEVEAKLTKFSKGSTATANPPR